MNVQRPTRRVEPPGRSVPLTDDAALALAGPIEELIADIRIVHRTRPSPSGPVEVGNDDQAQMLCRFESGAIGHLHVSRIATGRKMGYAYEISGTRGAVRFDQEDQNALWLHTAGGRPDRQGFTKILTGPLHPDYLAFCQGPGHGTGYQDQIIIEARDFLAAIATQKPVWPTFEDGHAVNLLIDAAWRSLDEARWVMVAKD